MAEYPPFKVPSGPVSLDPLAEMQFQQWVKQNNVPFDAQTSVPQDYDMRGYWQAQQAGQPMAGPTQVNPVDNKPHFTDYYKTPLHQSFSSESQWGNENTPQWINDTQLAAPNGRIVFDENKKDAIAKLLMGVK